MEYRILGPLEVLDEGREVPLGPAKERAVLAVLLLHAGEVVSRTQLIDGLWGDSPPPTAAKAVNVYVSQVRKTLARNGVDAITTRPSGYVLTPGTEAPLDAERFQEATAGAREHETAGELEAAAALMREALALWRGPALSGLELEGDGLNDIARLDELRLAAELDLVDYELALGRHEQLVPELERLVAKHPLNERLRGQLILALYRSGRQADALRAYRETRDTLVESLGIEPSTALQRLEHGILNHDPSLEAPAGVARSEPDRSEAIRPTEVGTAAFETEPSGSRRLIPLLVVLLIAAGSVAAFAVWRHPKSSAATSSAPPHSLVAIDPRTNSSTRIAMDWAPSALGLSDGAVWALDGADQVVARVDPRARRVEQVIGLGVTPTDVSVGAGSVWMLSDRGVVVQLDPALGIVRSSTKVPTGSAPEGGVDYATQIAADAHAIWIEDGRALWRIDPANRAVTRRLLVGGGIGGVALGAGSVWVLRREPAALLHINSRTGAVRATIPIAQRRGSTEPVPIGLAVGEGAVWVLDGNTGTVTRVDPDVDAVVATSRRVSMNPTGIAVGAGAVWVADGAANALVRLDPTTDRIAGSIPLGGLPKALVAGRSRVWVAVDV